MIIVLSGEAGAGKDSVAKVLVESHGFVLYSLAGPLKRFAEDMFGFTSEQLYGPSSARNAPDPKWDLKCDICKGEGSMKVYYTAPVGDSYGLLPCKKCNGTGKNRDQPANGAAAPRL